MICRIHMYSEIRIRSLSLLSLSSDATEATNLLLLVKETLRIHSFFYYCHDLSASSTLIKSLCSSSGRRLWSWNQRNICRSSASLFSLVSRPHNWENDKRYRRTINIHSYRILIQGPVKYFLISGYLCLSASVSSPPSLPRKVTPSP